MTTPTIVPDTQHLPVSGNAMYRKWIYLAGAASALAAGLILFADLIRLNEANNWLITIFRLLAGSNGVRASELYRLNALDLVLLALIAAAHAGLYAALHRSNRILALIAVLQPPLGILLFLLTHSAGRCAVMGAGLVASIAALRSGTIGKWTGSAGLISSVLLLAGDLGTSLAPCSLLAFSTGVGYILLIGWLLAVGRRLLQLAR